MYDYFEMLHLIEYLISMIVRYFKNALEMLGGPFLSGSWFVWFEPDIIDRT